MLTAAPPPGDPAAETGNSGFTLIETLAALAILSVALGVLLGVLGDGIGRQGRAEKLAMATLQAQSLLARVGVDIPLRPGSMTGTLSPGLRWRLHVELYGDATDRKAWPSAAYRVVVEVSPAEGSGGEPLVRPRIDPPLPTP